MADVTYLRTIYEVLAKRLTQTRRAHWVAEEMATLQDPDTYAMRRERLSALPWNAAKAHGLQGIAKGQSLLPDFTCNAGAELSTNLPLTSSGTRCQSEKDVIAFYCPAS